jgi:predicted DNA-binding protein
MSKEANRRAAQPMSLKQPDDLREELQAVSEELGETEATVARMSMRHGLKVLLASFKAKAAA